MNIIFPRELIEIPFVALSRVAVKCGARLLPSVAADFPYIPFSLCLIATMTSLHSPGVKAVAVLTCMSISSV